MTANHAAALCCVARLTSALSLLALVSATQEKPSFTIGACVPQMAMVPAMNYIFLDVFRQGVFDRWLPVGSADFDIQVEQVITTCQPLLAGKYGPDLLLGRGVEPGRVYDEDVSKDPIVGIVGCYCDSATSVMSTLSKHLDVPVITPVASDPKVSNKVDHPYIFRTCPTTEQAQESISIVAAEISSRAPMEGWRRVVVFFRADETMPSVLIDGLAARLHDPEIILVPVVWQVRNTLEGMRNYDKSLDDAIAIRLSRRKPKPRIFFEISSGFHFAKGLYEQGLLNSNFVWFSSLAMCSKKVLMEFSTVAKALVDGPVQPNMFTPVGKWDPATSFSPVFFGLVCVKPSIGEHIFGDPAFSTILNGFSWERAKEMGLPYDPATSTADFYFAMLGKDLTTQGSPPFLAGDAFLVLIHSISTLLFQNVPKDQIKGQTLIDAIKASDIQGITGRVKFDEAGNRRTRLSIDNLQASEADIHGDMVSVGMVDPFTKEVVYTAPIIFPDGGTDVPTDRPYPCGVGATLSPAETDCEDCPAGRFGAILDGWAICIDCLPGFFTQEPGATSCAAAAVGFFVPLAGRSNSTPCAVGTFVSTIGNTACKDCEVGKFNDAVGSSSCQSCPKGDFQELTGQTGCDLCEPWLKGATTPYQGAISPAACVCPEGMFRPRDADYCSGCPEGMVCEESSDMANLFEPDASYPKLLPGFWSPQDDVFNVFQCKLFEKCPGGDPGTCGPLLEGISCNHCKKGYLWEGGEQGCSKCPDVEEIGVLFPIIPTFILMGVPTVMYVQAVRDHHRPWDHWMNIPPFLLVILLNHFQVLDVAASTDIPLSDQHIEAYAGLGFANDMIGMFRPACAGVSSLQKQMTIKAVVPLLLGGWWVASFFGLRAAVKLTGRDHDVDKDVLICSYFSLLYAFFGAIAAMSTELFKCRDNPNGKMTMQSDASIICFESEVWTQMLVTAILSILLYVIGAGFILCRAIYLAPSSAADHQFRRRWKFLLMKHSSVRWWWGLAFLFKSFMVNFALALSSQPVVQLMIILSVVATYVLAVCILYPYRWDWANRLEICSGICIIINVTSLLGIAVSADTGTSSTFLEVFATTTAWFPIFTGLATGALMLDVRYRQPEVAKKLDNAIEESVLRYQKAFDKFSDMGDETIMAALHLFGDYEQNLFIQVGAFLDREFGGEVGPRLSKNILKGRAQEMIPI